MADDEFEGADRLDGEQTLDGETTDAEHTVAQSVDTPNASNAPTRLKYQFWSLVVVFNAALLAASIGVMLVGFRGDWHLGGQLFAAGVVLFVYGVYRYRTVTGELSDARKG